MIQSSHRAATEVAGGDLKTKPAITGKSESLNLSVCRWGGLAGSSLQIAVRRSGFQWRDEPGSPFFNSPYN
jgi:hypothetical protein